MIMLNSAIISKTVGHRSGQQRVLFHCPFFVTNMKEDYMYDSPALKAAAVANPGGANHKGGGPQLLLANFPLKPHENEKKIGGGGCPWRPFGSANVPSSMFCNCQKRRNFSQFLLHVLA